MARRRARPPMIGRVLTAYRQKYDITMRDLAREVGISAATICRVEAGCAVPERTFLRLVLWLFDDGKERDDG